jgi:hypothetical protein
MLCVPLVNHLWKRNVLFYPLCSEEGLNKEFPFLYVLHDSERRKIYRQISTILNVFQDVLKNSWKN